MIVIYLFILHAFHQYFPLYLHKKDRRCTEPRKKNVILLSCCRSLGKLAQIFAHSLFDQSDHLTKNDVTICLLSKSNYLYSQIQPNHIFSANQKSSQK